MAPTQRDELVSALKNAGSDMEGLLAQVGEARLAEPGVSEAWSVRDLLAHITAWEERIEAWVTALQTGTTPKPAPWSSDWSEDKINEWIFENNQNRSPDEVLQRWREVHQSVIDSVQTISDADLFERKIEWLGGNTLAGSIPGNSFEHIHAHAEAIRIWVTKGAES